MLELFKALLLVSLGWWYRCHAHVPVYHKKTGGHGYGMQERR